VITKEQVKKEVDKIPDNLLEEAYSLLKKITTRQKDFNWKTWEKNLEKFTADFMDTRTQALDSPRDSF
jgi:hypothetical protein